MESFLEKNKQENSHYGTVEFLHQDATQLTFEANRYLSNSIIVIYLFFVLFSFDIIFSNWLFMYLSDEETEQLLQKSLTWLKSDGTLFFRESCFHSSGRFSIIENIHLIIQ
jgi:phosphoethanolamine N-methyltransferase